MGEHALTMASQAGRMPASGNSQCMPTHALMAQNTAIHV